jgi:type 2 lantibiotic biosynthesis protein LanM
VAELPPHPLVLRVGRRADSCWHLALDISERCRKRDGLASVTVPLHGDHARLERWRRHYLFRINPAAYAERLAADCLTDADLAALLAEIPDHLATRTGPLPEDLRDLAALVEGDLFAETVVATTVSTGCSDPTHLVVLRLTAPIFAEAVGRLERSVTRLAASGTHVPFEPARAVALLTSQWLAQLTPLFLRTLALEVRIASLENKLHGETPEARFLDFAEGICTPERRRAFFLEYPVLARLVSRKLHHWVTFGLELLARLVNDWPDIVTTFFAGSDPGHVTSIVMGGGDSHQRGRSVVILRFERGVQLVYKPRSLAIDVHFQELLQWLNARLADASPAFPTFKTFRVIDRSDYGWCEFVASDTCDSPSQVTRFFMRQGANAALLHALNAVDFHSENVIAHGEHPALVDLETLFHPVVDLWSATQYRDPAAKMWSTTVVRLGLLPERAESSDGHVGYDISALGNRPGQVSAEPLPAITDAGTDLMRLTYKPIAIAVNDSIPTLQNERVDAAHYVPQIVDGFETMYRFLMKSREELVGGPFVAFRHDRVRHVVLATQLYDAILDTSLHPDYLRDAMERERILNRLWRVTKSDERFSRLFHAERADLLEGDIPYFWTAICMTAEATRCHSFLASRATRRRSVA